MIISDVVKKTKIDYVFTAISPNLPPRLQTDAIQRWMPAIGTAIIHGHMTPIPNRIGMEFVQTENSIATINEMLVGYFVRNPFDDVIAICKANVVLAPSLSPIFDFMDKSGTGRAWAFYSVGPGGVVPEVFITTTVVLRHLLAGFPNDLNMEGDEWSLYLHSWFSKNMPLHRYVDASSFGLIADRVIMPPEPATILSVTQLVEQTLGEIAPSRAWARKVVPEAIIEECPDIEVKVVKKRGRPRKAAKATK